MLKRSLLVLVLFLVLLALARLWLWESASKPTPPAHSFGEMPVDQAARGKHY